jgi:ribosome maturation factor RimP
MSRAADLETLLAPVVAEQGCELWGLEFSMQGRHSLLRLYIDAADGVTLEDCEKVSRQVSAVMDVEDPITSAYTLEVSSPGMNRPLYTLAQFQRYIGQQIAVRLRAPYEGRRKFQGTLIGLEDGDIVVQMGDTEFLLPFEGIDKANVVPVFGKEFGDGKADTSQPNQGLREGDAIDDMDLSIAENEDDLLDDEEDLSESDQ